MSSRSNCWAPYQAHGNKLVLTCSVARQDKAAGLLHPGVLNPFCFKEARQSAGPPWFAGVQMVQVWEASEVLDALVNSCHMATDGGVEVQTGQLLVWAVRFSLHSLKGVLHLSTALSLSLLFFSTWKLWAGYFSALLYPRHNHISLAVLHLH